MYYTDQQDQVTKIFNNLIKIVIGDVFGDNSTVLNIKMYRVRGNYDLVFTIRNRYNNPDILSEAVLETVDKCLEWFDLTDFVNFNIIIDIQGYRPTYTTYFELMYDMVKKSRGGFTYRHGRIDTNSRYEKCMRWNYEKERRDELNTWREKWESAKRQDMLMGGQRMFFESDRVVTVNKPKSESFIGKVRKKLVNLYYV